MFYEGDLQSGINKALQESKLVACFVTDEGEESQLWENDFLEEPSLKASLSQETVLLRLKAGSVEAGYLAAIFPLPKTPTLVIIQSGELKEYITAGVSKDDFLRRIRVLLESRGTSSQTTPAPEPSQTQASSSTAASNATSLPAEEALQPGTNQAAGRTAIGRESSPRLAQDQPGEASASSDPERKDQNRPEESGRKSEAQGRKPTPEDAPSVSQRLDSSDMSYAAMQRKRLQEAKEERARILKRVEDDKIERRKREAERKAELKAKEAGEHLGGQAESSRTEAPKPSRSKECAIQIRLFDGSTIRSRFPSSSTLRADVRPWVDEHQAGNAPYTFKHVLTPLPNKNISISDEEQTLESQGLTPSATLILVPVQGYVSAYEGGGNSGLVSKTISTGYGLVSSGVGMVSGLLGSFLGGGSSSSAQHEPASTTPAPPSAPNINIRTLRDQNRLDENQFYNGNSLNFEPRNDDEDKKDE